MKLKATMAVLLISSGCAAAYAGPRQTPSAPNSPPVLENVRSEYDPALKTITIRYDLLDAENDQVRVEASLVDGSGKAVPFSTDAATGDIGYPVSPGRKKRFVCRNGLSVADPAGYRLVLTANDLHEVDLQALVNQVDTLQIKRNLEQIYGVRNHKSEEGSRNLARTKAYIESSFAAKGLSTRRQPIAYAGYQAHNIIGRISGRSDSSKTHLLGAHFDTVEKSPGADDNGSGIAGMLEVMRILSNYEFNYSVTFVGFDLEEEQNSLGSYAYVHQEGGGAPEQIEGFINYDMIGYYSRTPHSQKMPDGFSSLFPEIYRNMEKNEFRGDFAVAAVNEASSALGHVFQQCAARYVPELSLVTLSIPGKGEMVPDLRRSDHANFWDKDYKAIYVGDGANTRNGNYHSPEDKLESINFTHIGNVVKTTVATLARLAEIRHTGTASSEIRLVGRTRRKALSMGK